MASNTTLELAVVLSFELLEPAGKILVRGKNLHQFQKRPHDRDVYLYSLLTVQDTGSMATPCSVKTSGAYRLPPRPIFEVANCDLKDRTSVGES